MRNLSKYKILPKSFQIEMIFTNPPSKPMQIIQADMFVVGQIHATFIDVFSKIVQAFRVQSKNAVEIVDSLINIIFT